MERILILSRAPFSWLNIVRETKNPDIRGAIRVLAETADPLPPANLSRCQHRLNALLRIIVMELPYLCPPSLGLTEKFLSTFWDIAE